MEIAHFRPLGFTLAPPPLRASYSQGSATQNSEHVVFSPGRNKNFAPRILSCRRNSPINFAAVCNVQHPQYLNIIMSKLLFASRLPHCFRYNASKSSLIVLPPPPMWHMKKTGLQSPRKKGGGSLATVCACKNACAANETLRWIFVGASLLLLLAKRTGVQKEHVVSMLALQLPNCAVTWIRGQKGLWVAFVGTIVQLFHIIPELEVPLNVLLLIITAPCQAMHVRASAASSVLSLAISSLLAYQHFSWLAKVTNPSQEVISLASAGILTLFIISLVLAFRSL